MLFRALESLRSSSPTASCFQNLETIIFDEPNELFGCQDQQQQLEKAFFKSESGFNLTKQGQNINRIFIDASTRTQWIDTASEKGYLRDPNNYETLIIRNPPESDTKRHVFVGIRGETLL